MLIPAIDYRHLLTLLFVFLSVLAFAAPPAPSLVSQASSSLSAAPEPVFQYRVLQKSFRKEPANTPEKMAQVMKNLVPDDIKPWAVISLTISEVRYYILEGDTVVDFCKRFDKLGYRFMVEIGDPALGGAAPGQPNAGRKAPALEDLEQILANCPNCIGAETGETFWAFTGKDNPVMDKWLMDVLRVCAKNQKYFLLGEGTWNTGHWSRFFFKNYAELQSNKLGQWLVPAYKNTKPWGALQNVSSIYGAWVTGLVGNYGMWNDPWTWCYSSFGNANELPPYRKADRNQERVPYTYFLRMWLLGISQGAVFSCTEEPCSFNRDGESNSNFSKYLHPFIKGVGEHHILPRRSAVLEKTKAIVDAFGDYQTALGNWVYDPSKLLVTYLDNPTSFAPKCFDPFTVLFRNTYGFDPIYDKTDAAGQMFPREPSLPNRLTRETIPNSSRFYAIPITPGANSPKPSRMAVLKLNQARDDASISRFYQDLYSADPYGTQAYAIEVDNSFFVLNSNENLDRDQFYKFKLGDRGLLFMEGMIPFQNLVFGKREGENRYWFQTIGYTGDGKTTGQRYQCTPRPTVITFTSDVPPVITPEPSMAQSMTITSPWNPQTRTLTVSFDHANGAVNFTISCGKTL